MAVLGGWTCLGMSKSASHLFDSRMPLTTGWNMERCEPLPENAFRLISARRE
ncbi:hypothetical protein ACNKHL_05800 [Shigella flexneri]